LEYYWRLMRTNPVAYSNDFEKAEVGKVPDEFMVLDGPFAVRQVDGNKCLELTGDPIGAFGALFGPAGVSGSEVSARIWASPTGKRFPEFGIGANDAGGYKLMLLPGQNVVELRKGEEPLATAPFKWTALHLDPFQASRLHHRQRLRNPGKSLETRRHRAGQVDGDCK